MKELHAKAEGGDGEAIGIKREHEYGECGLAVDKAQARALYALNGGPRPKGFWGKGLLGASGGPQCSR